MADEDFEQQLELEKLEQEKKERVAAGTDPYTYVDPNDGTVYEWDHAKQAWFPKVDDDFIAKYQENYSYQEPETESKETDAAEKAPDTKGEKRKANDPCWFQVDDDRNTNVYVSGLPADTTEEEFVELMGKCGMVMKDPDTMKYKIKLYRDKDGTLKGDGRCCYIKIESVKLALDILDGYQFKGKQIHVERAQFELKGQYDPTKKPKKKKPKDKEKLKKKLDKLFDWRPDKLRGQRSKNENTVIIKNMFEPKEFDQDATLLLDYQNDIREECSKCGEVKKVVIYDRNPEGVVAVTFTEPEMADECVNLMNNRYFAMRRLTAETWDGKTRYKVFETEEELQKRLDNWDKYLDEKDDQEAAAKLAAAAAASSSSQPNANPAALTNSASAVSSSSQPVETSNSVTSSGTAASSSSQLDTSYDSVTSSGPASSNSSQSETASSGEKLNVPSSAYELAGDTDSSGDSGDEGGR